MILYDISEKVDEITLTFKKNLIPIIDDIKNKKTNPCKNIKPFFSFIYNIATKKMHVADKNYNISNDCISCNTCVTLIPIS